MDKNISHKPTTRSQLSMTVLETIVTGLELPDKARADMITYLRNMNMRDDNDPVLEITFIMGILTRLTGEIPARIEAQRLALTRESEKALERQAKMAAELERMTVLARDFLRKYTVEAAEAAAKVEETARKCSSEFEAGRKKLEEVAEGLHKRAEEFKFWSWIQTAMVVGLGVFVILVVRGVVRLTC